MQRYILMRVLQGILSIIVIMIAIFLIVRASGNPLDLLIPPDAPPETRVIMTHELGLDRSLPEQFFIFARDIVRGRFGYSFRYDVDVLELVLNRMPNTVTIATAAFVFGLLVGLPVGILSAMKPDGGFDRFGKIFALLGQSIPSFWLALILMMVFAVMLRWVPAAGKGGIDSYILPTVSLGWYSVAAIARLTRSSMLDTLDSDYITMARMKGVPEYSVVLKHAFRNAVNPVLTLAGLQFVGLIGGSVIVEQIFAWPGMGKLAVDAILARDYPVVQCVVFLTSVLLVGVNLVVDILYAYVDPRIHYQ